MESLGSNRQIGNGMQHLLFMVWYCLTRHGKFKKIYDQTCVIKARRGDERRYEVVEIEMGRSEFSIFGTSSKIAFPVVKKCCRQAVPDLHDEVRLLSNTDGVFYSYFRRFTEHRSLLVVYVLTSYQTLRVVPHGTKGTGPRFVTRPVYLRP